MPTVLIIDDNPAVATALDVLLSLEEVDSVYSPTPEEGLRRISRGGIDLVIQDMNFEGNTTSGIEGEALFARIRRLDPELPVILLTAWTHLEAAVALVKAGAADYLAKPWDDQKMLTTIRNLIELGQRKRESAAREQVTRKRRLELSERYDLRGLVFADPLMEQSVRMALQFARSDLPVLITGPNGSGKEKLAELVHANSPRSSGPWVAVNCAALPGPLIEAELFGAEKGAYTGANAARAGRFEAADGGTLFLDEIGTLPLSGQTKLLRVLETGCFARLGSNEERKTSVRVVSATNADLAQMILDHEFRQDLFYRINTLEVNLPPLVERVDDIIPLAEHFLGGRKQLDPRSHAPLLRYAWPGNVRELRNVIERAALLAPQDSILPSDLQLPEPALHKQKELSAEMIEGALIRHRGVIAHAAQELGISRQALYRRMDKLGISRSR